MKDSRYIPRYQKEWKDLGDGQFRAKIYTCYGVVEVFTYEGGRHGAAFTALEMYIDPHVYERRIPRHYHQRWLLRLARDFACDCHNLSQE